LARFRASAAIARTRPGPFPPQESIPSLRQCLDKPGIIGVVTQSFPHTVDCFVEATVEIDDDIGGPKPLLEFFPRHDFARALDQRHQGLKRLLLQLDPYALFAQFSGGQVDLKDPNANRRRSDIQEAESPQVQSTALPAGRAETKAGI
jgi:hypothetical protein